MSDADSPDRPATATTTSTYLLAGLMDPANRTVWSVFVDRYRPVIIRFARKQGLSAEDSEDVAQRALAAFNDAYRAGKYDRERGRLRDWLFGIARLETKNWRRQQAQRREQPATGNGPSGVMCTQEDPGLRAAWDEEWRNAVLQTVLGEVRNEVHSQTFQAFELFACQGWPARRVAEHLGITENAVFGAKRRVLQRVRELIPSIEEVW